MKQEYPSSKAERTSSATPANVGQATTGGKQLPAVIPFQTNKEKEIPESTPPLQQKEDDTDNIFSESNPVQKTSASDVEVPSQAKFILQRQEEGIETSIQRGKAFQLKLNNTGLPNNLKSGIEHLSSINMDDVHVHYNSSKPAQLNALAYAQGSDIHVAPGQEKHLPHEAWHVVQQKQGRVKSTLQLKQGVAVNDDKGLEHEADVMGQKAMQHQQADFINLHNLPAAGNVTQRITGFEIETFIPLYRQIGGSDAYVAVDKMERWQASIGDFLFGGVLYGHTYAADPDGHFTVSADHNGRMTGAHQRLLHLLSLAGFIKPDSPFRGMAIAEYITAPIDETTPDAQGKMNERISYTQAHIGKALSMQSAAQSLPMLNGNGVFTGIPADDIIAWVRRHAAQPGIIIDAVRELMEVANDAALNMQKTTGVLPEDIPQLYEHAQSKLSANDSKPSQIMNTVLALSLNISGTAFGTTAVPEPLTPHAAALHGFLTYLATHILVDNLSATSYIPPTSTEKNLFPYFPKVPLSTALQAMPAATLLPDYVAYWEVLIDAAINGCAAYNIEFWQNTFKLGNHRKNIESGIFGDKITLTPSVLKTKAIETLKKLVSDAHPEVNIGVYKHLPGLDSTHPAIEARTGQKGIPVEDRYFNQKYKTGINISNVVDITNQEFGEAHSRMNKHLKEGDVDSRTDNSVVSKGRYRDLKNLTVTLEKYLLESIQSTQAWEEKGNICRQELERLLARDPQKAPQEKEMLEHKGMELSEQMTMFTLRLQDAQNDLTLQKEKLEGERSVLFGVFEKTTEEDKLNELSALLDKLALDIDATEDRLYEIEDGAFDEKYNLEEAIRINKTELETYTPGYFEKVEETAFKCRESREKSEHYTLTLQTILSESNKVIRPMSEAESSLNFDPSFWIPLQTKAGEIFMDAKKIIWEKAHIDNPNAGLLDLETLKKEYRNSLGFNKTIENSKHKPGRLSKIKDDNKYFTTAQELAPKLSIDIKTLSEGLEKLDTMVGVNTTDEILEFIGTLFILNKKILEESEIAKEILNEKKEEDVVL